jgi:hypothetical protein
MERVAMSEPITTEQLLFPAFALVRKAPGTALLAVVALATLTILTEMLDSMWLRLTVMGIAAAVAQCEVTRRLLRSVGRPGTRRPYGTVLVVGVVTGLLSGAGFVVFVLPGLYLLARWLPSNVVAISEAKGPFDAIGTSWERTRKYVPPISVALVLTFLPPIALGMVIGSFTSSAGLAVAPQISDLAGCIGIVLTWYLAVATHVALQPMNEELVQIFA